MRITTLTIIPLLAIAASCGGSGASSNDFEFKATSDLQNLSPSLDRSTILAKAYDTAYTVPPDFFRDEREETTTGSYTVHHVLDPSGSFELCSDDIIEAQAWEEADNAARGVSGYYVTSYENDRYFEFVRELTYDNDVGNISSPTTPGYARVFKCGHTNRQGVDRALLDGYSGRIAQNLVTSDALKDFTEYLWQFRFFNVRRKVVLDSRSENSAGVLQHSLFLALVNNQGAGRCDRIDVVKWRFYVPAGSNRVEREFETMQSFKAQLVGGVATLCD